MPKVLNQAAMKVHKLTEQGQTLTLPDILQLYRYPSSAYLDELESIRYYTNQQDWSGLNQIKDLHIALLVVIEYLKGLDKYTLNETQLQVIVDDHTKLDTYLIGTLTTIADVLSCVTKSLKDYQEIDSVYEETVMLILQDDQRGIFKEYLMKMLKTLGKAKEEIYLKEDFKEDEEMSPIKQQMLISTDPDLYKKEVRRRSILEG